MESAAGDPEPSVVGSARPAGCRPQAAATIENIMKQYLTAEISKAAIAHNLAAVRDRAPLPASCHPVSCHRR